MVTGPSTTCRSPVYIDQYKRCIRSSLGGIGVFSRSWTIYQYGVEGGGLYRLDFFIVKSRFGGVDTWGEM